MTPSDVIEGVATVPYYYRSISLYIYKKMNGCTYEFVCVNAQRQHAARYFLHFETRQIVSDDSEPPVLKRTSWHPCFRQLNQQF